MSQHTTTTSGAAIQRYKIDYREDEWGRRTSTPSGIPDAAGSWVRYADHVAALAAGQATAAQQGAVYAELPAPTASIGTDDAWHEAAMRAFADATHTLRASHGQAPARDLAAVIKGAADKMDAAVRCHPDAVDTLIHEALEILDGDREPDATPASHGQAPAYEAGWKDGYKQGAWSATAPTAKAAGAGIDLEKTS